MTARRIGGGHVLDRLQKIAGALALHHGLEVLLVLLGVHLVVGRDEVVEDVVLATRRQNSANNFFIILKVFRFYILTQKLKKVTQGFQIHEKCIFVKNLK